MADEAIRRGNIKRRAGLRTARRQKLNLLYIYKLRGENAVAGYARQAGDCERRAKSQPAVSPALWLE